MPQAVGSVQHGATAPAIAIGAGAGAGSVSLSANASDTVGVANVTTAAGVGAGTLCTITFAKAFKTAPKVAFVTRVDGLTAQALLPIVGTISTTALVIATPSTPAQPIAYQIAYLVVPEDGEV